MPEGPEVQTIVNSLNRTIVDYCIRDIEFVEGADNMIKPLTVSDFREQVIGQKIKIIHRRGKSIDIALSSGTHLITHLLITGQLFLNKDTDKSNYPNYLRLIIKFDNGQELYIADRSKWVKVGILSDAQTETYRKFRELGVDILSDHFTYKIFHNLLASTNTKKRIHPLLLDQKILSGLGNIYVNEVLFYAGIHPLKKTNLISEDEIMALYYAIRHVTKEALKQKGTTFSDYRTPDGGKGQYQKYLKVFKRANQPCIRCGTTIERIKVSGRGAFFCSKDQSQETTIKENIPQQLTFDTFNYHETNNNLSNFIFVLIGPSSVGKTTLSRQITKHIPFVKLVPTLKTRKPRTGEILGIDNIFVSDIEFERIINNGNCILYESIYDSKYATPKAIMENALKEGSDALIILSPNGAKKIKHLYDNVHVIGLFPSSLDIIKERTAKRKDYSEIEKIKRIAGIEKEYTSIKDSCDSIIEIDNSTKNVLHNVFDIIYTKRCKTT